MTLTDRGNFVIDDEHAYAPLASLGWQVDAVPWSRAGVRWDDYELVVIRSTWDYQSDPDLFLRVLAEIEASTARLVNPRDIVIWNLRKTYLRDLAARGVDIVPTVWLQQLDSGGLSALFEELGSQRIVIKPQLGANADGAFLIDQLSGADRYTEIETYYARTPLMAQPFARHILDEGEYSLFFFNGRFSHAVLKTPRNGDFRCQEEHGASIKAMQIDDALYAAGQSAIKAIGETLLYARADFLRRNDSRRYWLMELELIEPSLYLRMSPEAPGRFAEAIDVLTDQSTKAV